MDTPSVQYLDLLLSKVPDDYDISRRLAQDLAAARQQALDWRPGTELDETETYLLASTNGLWQFASSTYYTVILLERQVKGLREVVTTLTRIIDDLGKSG